MFSIHFEGLLIQQNDCFERHKFAKSDLHMQRVSRWQHPCHFPAICEQKVVFFWLRHKTHGKLLSVYYWVIAVLGKIAKHSRSQSRILRLGASFVLRNLPRAACWAVYQCYFTCYPMIDILGSFCLGKPVPFTEAPLCLNPSAENHLTLLCLTSYSWWDLMELNTWFCQEQVDFFPFWVFPRWPLKSRKSMLLKCTT